MRVRAKVRVSGLSRLSGLAGRLWQAGCGRQVVAGRLWQAGCGRLWQRGFGRLWQAGCGDVVVVLRVVWWCCGDVWCCGLPNVPDQCHRVDGNRNAAFVFFVLSFQPCLLLCRHQASRPAGQQASRPADHASASRAQCQYITRHHHHHQQQQQQQQQQWQQQWQQ